MFEDRRAKHSSFVKWKSFFDSVFNRVECRVESDGWPRNGWSASIDEEHEEKKKKMYLYFTFDSSKNAFFLFEIAFERIIYNYIIKSSQILFLRIIDYVLLNDLATILIQDDTQTSKKWQELNTDHVYLKSIYIITSNEWDRSRLGHGSSSPFEEIVESRNSRGHPVHTREERTILHSPRWPFMGGVPLDRTHGVTG